MSAPIWVGLYVEPAEGRPKRLRLYDSELVWLGVAGPGFDFARAEGVCAARRVYQVIFQRGDVSLNTEYDPAGSFAEFVEICRDELARDNPTFDSEAEEALARDAIRALRAELERPAR